MRGTVATLKRTVNCINFGGSDTEVTQERNSSEKNIYIRKENNAGSRIARRDWARLLNRELEID